jgi:predicted nucleotidyltransferase
VRSIHSSKRRQVAREAAELLYTGQEKEYKQAKLRAAKILGIRILPSNAEIADQLDTIAQEREGKSRTKKLVQMRQEALQMMLLLEEYNPRLVGSVWRGTSHHNSDIDIMVFTGNFQEVTSIIQTNDYNITDIDNQMITKKGIKKGALHIHVKLPSNRQAEIAVHNVEDVDKREKCEIYGDNKTGLTTLQLQQVLREDPERRFTP